MSFSGHRWCERYQLLTLYPLQVKHDFISLINQIHSLCHLLWVCIYMFPAWTVNFLLFAGNKTKFILWMKCQIATIYLNQNTWNLKYVLRRKKKMHPISLGKNVESTQISLALFLWDGDMYVIDNKCLIIIDQLTCAKVLKLIERRKNSIYMGTGFISV